MATNYGFINNIATGLREGLMTYQTISKMKQDERNNKIMQQLLLKKEGLIESPEGELIETEDQRAKKSWELNKLRFENAKSERGYDLLDPASPVSNKVSKISRGLIKQVTGEDPGEDQLAAQDILDIMPLLRQNADPYGIKAFDAYNKMNDPYNRMGEAERVVARDSAKKYSDVSAIKESMDEVISQLRDPNLPYEQKLTAARGSLKLINSASLNAPDVVGAEESKRVGALINPSLINALPGQAGAVIKPDVEGFTQQLENISKAMANRSLKLQDRAGLKSKGLIEEKDKKSGGPKVGEIVDGYKFLGGDPANKDSWSKK